jgi:hypothetical protein
MNRRNIMSGLLVPLGFPTTQAPGTEGLGVGVDTTTLTTVAPNGTSSTPVALQTEISTVLKNGNQSILPLWRQSINASPNI